MIERIFRIISSSSFLCVINTNTVVLTWLIEEKGEEESEVAIEEWKEEEEEKGSICSIYPSVCLSVYSYLLSFCLYASYTFAFHSRNNVPFFLVFAFILLSSTDWDARRADWLVQRRTSKNAYFIMISVVCVCAFDE